MKILVVFVREKKPKLPKVKIRDYDVLRRNNEAWKNYFKPALTAPEL